MTLKCIHCGSLDDRHFGHCPVFLGLVGADDRDAALAAKDAEIAALRERCERLAKSLAWAVGYVDDGLTFSDDDRPIHECEFSSNPERGACSFCEGYWTAKDLLNPKPDVGEESTDGA